MTLLNRVNDRERGFKKQKDNEDYWQKTQMKQYEAMTKPENTHIYKSEKDYRQF